MNFLHRLELIYSQFKHVENMCIKHPSCAKSVNTHKCTSHQNSNLRKRLHMKFFNTVIVLVVKQFSMHTIKPQNQH